MIKIIIGILIGGGLGYLIGRHMSIFGLECPLICNPKISTIYFAIMGAIMAAGN